MRRIVVAAVSLGVAAGAAHTQKYKLGQPVTKELLSAWDIDVRPDGQGLPPGKGSVAQGQKVYADNCASCHGDKGQGVQVPGLGGFDRLVGGAGTLDKPNPIMTVGSFWPYATTLFDYVRRAMPFTSPQSLSNDEIYAVTAYVLHMNGIIPDSAALDAGSLTQVKMPNRDGFIVEDPRPDVKSKAQ